MSAEGQPRRSITLDITILGREFKVACKESERAELTEAVALLDKRMREIRDGGKVTAVDRIAVMAAVNLAHDLLRARSTDAASSPMPIRTPRPFGVRRRIVSIKPNSPR